MAINTSDEWRALAEHHARIADVHLRDLFRDQPDRGATMNVEVGDLYLDYSKNRVTPETIDLLVKLARRAGVEELRDELGFVAARNDDRNGHTARDSDGEIQWRK